MTEIKTADQKITGKRHKKRRRPQPTIPANSDADLIFLEFRFIISASLFLLVPFLHSCLDLAILDLGSFSPNGNVQLPSHSSSKKLQHQLVP